MAGIHSACANSDTPATHQARTQELAERCLRGNPYLALRNVSCDCQDGVVILQGCLPSYYLRQIAQEVVAHQRGVDRVENQIEVLMPAARLSQS